MVLVDRPATKDQTWTIVVNGGGLEPRELYRRERLTKFNRVFWLNAMGVRGWDLVDCSVERATFPGDSIGLEAGNKITRPHSYTFTFKRLLQRPITEAEQAQLQTLGL